MVFSSPGGCIFGFLSGLYACGTFGTPIVKAMCWIADSLRRPGGTSYEGKRIHIMQARTHTIRRHVFTFVTAYPRRNVKVCIYLCISYRANS